MTPRDRPRVSYTLLFGGGIVALVVASAALLIGLRSGEKSPTANRSTPPAHEVVPTPPPGALQLPASPGGPVPSHAAPESLPPEFSELDIGDMPPPESSQTVTGRPERQDFTEEEKQQKRVEALAMLDRHIERLQGELAALEKDGKTQEAAALRVRIDRMRKLREKRAAQLDGGTDAAPDRGTDLDRDAVP